MATFRLSDYYITLNSSKNANSDSTLVVSGSLLIQGYCPTAGRLKPIPVTSEVHDIGLRQAAWYGSRSPALNIGHCHKEQNEISDVSGWTWFDRTEMRRTLNLIDVLVIQFIKWFCVHPHEQNNVILCLLIFTGMWITSCNLSCFQ